MTTAGKGSTYAPMPLDRRNAVGIGVIQILRGLVTISFVCTLLVQVLVVPRAADVLRRADDESAILAQPYALAMTGALVFVELAMCAFWRMLSLSRRGLSSGTPIARSVDAVAVFLWIGLAIAGATFAHACLVARTGGPVVFFGLVATVVASLTVFTGRTELRTTFVVHTKAS